MKNTVPFLCLNTASPHKGWERRFDGGVKCVRWPSWKQLHHRGRIHDRGFESHLFRHWKIKRFYQTMKGTEIYIGKTNKKHIKQKHPYAYQKYFNDIGKIISYSDYVCISPKDGFIEHMKQYKIENKYVKVASRVTNIVYYRYRKNLRVEQAATAGERCSIRRCR